jgi:hypothetical protein
MSAGVMPEGFENYMLDVRDASIHAVQALGEYDDKVMLPALMMAIVSVVRIYVDEGKFESMDFGMGVVNAGITELAHDHKRDIDGLDNGN